MEQQTDFQVVLPLLVHFTNLSTNATSYYWTFGDGGTSTLANPTHYFPYTGSFTVTLIAYDSTACGIFSDTSSQTFYFTIYNPPPVPILTQNGDTLISSFTNHNQWFRDHILQQGDTNQTYIVHHTGCYYVMYTDSNGCTSTSDTICFSFAGINEIHNNHGINIYPDPNQGSFTLTYSHLSTSYSQFIIKDVLGRTVYTHNIFNIDGKETISVSDLSSGIYYWEMMSKQGIVGTGKIVLIKD